MRPYSNRILPAASLAVWLSVWAAAAVPGDDAAPPATPYETAAEPDRSFIAAEGAKVTFFDRSYLATNRTARIFITLFGDAAIDGEVEEGAVVIGGSAKVNGEIQGDLVVLGGSAELGPHALINGAAIIIGGPLKLHPDAQILDEPVVVNLPRLSPLLSSVKDWIGNCLLLGRPLAPSRAGAWYFIAALLILSLVVAVFLPRPVSLSVDTLSTHPATAFFIGLLGFALTGPLIVILVATVAGVILVPLLMSALALALLLGNVAVCTAAGKHLGDRFGASIFSHSIPSFFLGAGVFLLAFFVPVIGFLALGFLLPLGLGAVLFSTTKRLQEELDRRPCGDSPSVTIPSLPAMPGDSEPGRTPVPIPASREASAAEGRPDDKTAAEASGMLCLPRVGFWPRFAAAILDLILYSALYELLNIARIDDGPRVFILGWLAYHLVMWGIQGTTLGGMILRLRCVRVNGTPLSWGVATIRVLATLFSFLVIGLGFFWASWSRERQAWHDIIADTTVVQLPKDQRTS